MSWLLGVFDHLWPGPGLFVAFDTAIIAGGLLALLLLGRRISWPTTVLAGALMLLPQVLIYPGIVWKDVLFASSAVAGFALLAHAAVCWNKLARRYALLAAALPLLSLAALTRQNGGVILPFAAAAVGWIATTAAPRAKALSGLGHGLGFLTAGALVVICATTALNTQNLNPQANRGSIFGLQTYDIVSALVLQPKTELRLFRARAPWLETMLRTEGVAVYSPVRIDPLEPMLNEVAAHGDEADLIAAQWRDIFQRHPLLLASVRAKAFEWVLLTPDHADCVLIYTGVDGDPDDLADAGLVRRYSGLDKALERYAFLFASTPVYSHAAYGALSLALLVPLLRRRRAADVMVGAMIASGLAFALSFAAISIACDYRYLYGLDLTVIAGALYSAATWRDGREPSSP